MAAIDAAMHFLAARGCVHATHWPMYLRKRNLPFKSYCRDHIIWALMTSTSSTAAELVAGMDFEDVVRTPAERSCKAVRLWLQLAAHVGHSTPCPGCTTSSCC